MDRSVTVTGSGQAHAQYDLATVALAATAQASTPADATARASYAGSRMREAVLGVGVPESALATNGVRLNPVHDPWPTVVAYEASLGLSVVVEDLAVVGSLLVAAVEAGGDGSRVDAVTFSHKDPAALQALARTAAFEDAVARARQYAGLAGQALGEVRHVVEGGFVGGQPRPVLLSKASAAGPAPEVDAGEGAVGAAVTVTWALGPA